MTQNIRNYINGGWCEIDATEFVEVVNPATQELLAKTPLSNAETVDTVAQAAATAFPDWRNTPAGERIQPLFKLKTLLEEHIDEIARLITLENGKTVGEAIGEMRRAIENVEVACGIPTMMLGDFTEAIVEAAATRVVGSGLDDGVEMGPVISPASKERIEGIIATGIEEGAQILVDGRGKQVAGYETGNFILPTVISELNTASEVLKTEIFGPVLGMVHLDTVESAIELVNSSEYGNMACLFTSSGAAARKFRHDVQAGNVGINIGVAAPMAYFPFSGWKESFFGTLHG